MILYWVPKNIILISYRYLKEQIIDICNMNVLIYEKINNWYFKYKDIDIWKINTLIDGKANNWYTE